MFTDPLFFLSAFVAPLSAIVWSLPSFCIFLTFSYIWVHAVMIAWHPVDFTLPIVVWRISQSPSFQCSPSTSCFSEVQTWNSTFGFSQFCFSTGYWNARRCLNSWEVWEKEREARCTSFHCFHLRKCLHLESASSGEFFWLQSQIVIISVWLWQGRRSQSSACPPLPKG